MIVVCLFSLPAHAKYGGGTGEPNDPYEIATAEELILLSESPEDYDKYFILTANIDLDPNLPGGKVFDRAVIAADTDDVERGFQGTYFTGVFDGNGHTVSRITIRGDDYLGLFGWLEYESEIRDLGVVNINIIGSGHRVGGLIGWNLGGRLVNCYSTGTVNGDSYVGGLIGAVDLGGSIINCYSTSTVSGSGEVGGLLGWNLYGSIINCYSTGTVSGHGAVGGLVGVNKGEINNCYSTSMVSGESLVGGLVGNHQYLSTITNCYATGSVTGTRYVGGLVGVNDLWGEDRLGEVIFSFWDVETSGQTTSAGGTGKTTAEMQDPNTFMASGWNFVGKSDGPSDIWAEPAGGGYPILWFQPSPLSELPAFSEGAGEPNNPYLISTASDLNSIGHNPRLMDGHFMLTNDIDLAGIDFYIIGSKTIPFTGVFDGNGFMVSNLSYASADTHYVGLFGHVYRPGKIKDLGLSDPNIDAGAGHYVSSLVGYLLGGNIKNSYVQDGSVTGTTYVGGLVGRNCSGTITNCYSSAAVSGIWVIGGLVGYIDYEGGIINSYSTGSVIGGNYVGGLVGDSDSGTITNCYAEGGDVWGGYIIGGLVGESYNSTIAYCYSTSNVAGIEYVGGLVGDSRENVSVISSFWDMETSELAISDGGIGKTTAEMQMQSTFTDVGWDFFDETVNGTEDIWKIDEGLDYPRLWWEILVD